MGKSYVGESDHATEDVVRVLHRGVYICKYRSHLDIFIDNLKLLENESDKEKSQMAHDHSIETV